MPPRLLRRRIEVHVGDFLSWLDGWYAARGWQLGPITPPPANAPFPLWETRDVSIQITHHDEADGRPRELEMTLRNVPGVPKRPGEDGLTKQELPTTILWDHAFAIVLPDDYPSDLRMRIVNLSETVHPRMMTPDKAAPACIFPNAELDLVLREVLWNVLLKPDVVRPPTLYDGADLGYRPREMQWYAAYGPQRLFDELMTAWDARQRELTPPALPAAVSPAAPAAPFVIRGFEPPPPAQPPAVSPPPAAPSRERVDLPPLPPPASGPPRRDPPPANSPFRIRE